MYINYSCVLLHNIMSIAKLNVFWDKDKITSWSLSSMHGWGPYIDNNFITKLTTTCSSTKFANTFYIVVILYNKRLSLHLMCHDPHITLQIELCNPLILMRLSPWHVIDHNILSKIAINKLKSWKNVSSLYT